MQSAPSESPQRDPRRGQRPLWIGVLLFTLFCLLLVALRIPVLSGLAILALAAEVLLVIAWGTVRVLRVVLWRVGRLLAFTYFLIGVLPIPLVITLLFVAAYLLSGFFLGHLYRDAATTLHEELRSAATTRLAATRLGVTVPAESGSHFAFAYFRDGRKIAGDPRAPSSWPAWLEDESREAGGGSQWRPTMPALVALADEELTLASAVADAGVGVLAFFDGDLQTHLSRRSGTWIDLVRTDDPRKETMLTLNVFDETFVLQPLSRPGAGKGREEFLQIVDPGARLRVIGFELAGPLHDFSDGEILSPSVSATLTATPAIVRRFLFPNATEVDTLAWGAFFVTALLLFDIYAVAALMALLLILGLSRAVNRISRATHAVQAGDFSTRIPVRRRDQIGALQKSFNRMTANLETLVATAAKKERLEKELEIARELQESLLPEEMDHSGRVSFSTFFQPSAAIGGDYFDILALGADGQGAGAGGTDSERLAVVIADVSGHGLSAGLGMAMLKAALHILVREGKDPESIMTSLDHLVRSNRGKAFVTSTLTLVDLTSGELEIINAGHPPTYLLRNGEVQEILLPSTPLGALGQHYAHRRLSLQSGDVVIWLSDGFIEAADDSQESFGYERAREALCGGAGSPAAVRDRFLRAVREHTATREAEDDCTLVVMQYQPTRRSQGEEDAQEASAAQAAGAAQHRATPPL